MKITDEISGTLIKRNLLQLGRRRFRCHSLFYRTDAHYFITRINFPSHFLDSCKLKTNKFELKTGRFFIKLCHSSLHRFF